MGTGSDFGGDRSDQESDQERERQDRTQGHPGEGEKKDTRGKNRRD